MICKKYFVLIIWNLLFYFLGILSIYLDLDIFEINIFNLFITFFGFISSFPNIILDENLPKDTIKKLYNLNIKNKFKIFISCFPVYNFIVISYIDLDPIIIQLLVSTSIIFNLIISSLYYYNFTLLKNPKILLCIIINIFGCILPIIFKINIVKFGIIGLINTIINIILLAIVTTLNENLKNLDFDYDKELNTFIIFTYLFIELIIFILLLPLFYYIKYIYNNNNYIINIIKLKDLFLYSSLLGIIYGFIYISTTKSYLYLTSFDIGIIKNINLILVTLLSCLFNISLFNYLYIPSIFLIIISSIIIVKIKSNINNNIENLS
jgi:hypothetical protein